MQAMLFAAGFGTRLEPLTHVLPKPVVPLANRPASWFALDHLLRNGIADVVVNTHSLANQLRHSLEPWIPQSMRLSFVHEPILLGTGGGLKNAWKINSDEPIVLVNSDMLFAPDLEAARKAHADTQAVATMVLRKVPDPDRYGAVSIDPNGRVQRIAHYSSNVQGNFDKYMFTGVHILAARAFKDLPESGCIIRSAYQTWLHRNEMIASVIDDHPWYDLGTLKTYLMANCALASGIVQWKGIEPVDQCIIHETSRVLDGARVHRVIAGAHTKARRGVNLEQVVLWDGAEASSSLKNAIVTGTEVGLVQL